MQLEIGKIYRFATSATRFRFSAWKVLRHTSNGHDIVFTEGDTGLITPHHLEQMTRERAIQPVSPLLSKLLDFRSKFGDNEHEENKT